MICQVHGKEMRYSPKFGFSCPTPVEKSPDGKAVTKWCDWKPAVDDQKPEYTPQMAEKAGEIREQIAEPLIKKHDSMFLCNAMNNSIAYMAANHRSIDDLEEIFDQVLKVLER